MTVKDLHGQAGFVHAVSGAKVKNFLVGDRGILRVDSQFIKKSPDKGLIFII